MKANEAKLLDFLKKSTQFIIPIYQRTYSWTKSECEQLWMDILKTGKEENIPAHFIGSIVYIEKGLYQVSSQPTLLVIDGQQRLTTVSLIIEALARNIGNTEPLEGFSEEKLRNYYLLNPYEKKDRHYKLLLSQTDKDSLLALFNQRSLPEEHSVRIKENFDFFEKKIKELDSNIESLCKGLAKLIIVDISLDREKDNPQLIFESMNSTGRELSQADLIRNFILMGLEQEDQKKIYENHWRPMERAFGQEAYSNHFDSFIRDYLTLKTKEIPNVKKVYEAFKEYARNKEMHTLVADIHKFANYYCAISLNKETEKTLKNVFRDLRELKVNVSYPFLLKVYDDYKKDLLSAEDFRYIVQLVENYVFRRAVCNIPTNSLNKFFSTFSRAIKEDRYLESVKAHFLLRSLRHKFPTDDEFFRVIQNRDLYNFRNCKYLLRKLENYNRKEKIGTNEFTVEHILPQNENLSQKWQQALGSRWKEIQEKYLHTLGNLTLTGYNSTYKDKFFIEKQEIKGGFKESPLHLNKGLRHIEAWGENEIKERAKQLAKKAVTVWSAPSLSSEVLNSYQPKKQQEEQSNYTLTDYPYLDNDFMKSLFTAFQKEVLNLNQYVTEECRKFYIAYKAEGNFVCVIPQARRLRLSLGLKMHELHDPKGIARDISDIGRWGTGDVEVGLKSKDELPYVMGLIRQALEKQIDDSDIEDIAG